MLARRLGCAVTRGPEHGERRGATISISGATGMSGAISAAIRAGIGAGIRAGIGAGIRAGIAAGISAGIAAGMRGGQSLRLGSKCVE